MKLTCGKLRVKDFTKQIPRKLLDIQEKNRSNLFAWRGQFSPQLIEALLNAYCLPESVILDPFAGSGTVLYEAARMQLPAFGFEINPSAWVFSKLYEFANASRALRDQIIDELRDEIKKEFPLVLFSQSELDQEELEERIIRIGRSVGDQAKVLCNALVVLLDIFKNDVTSDLVQSKFWALAELVRSLPYSEGLIKADLQDARNLALENQTVDFVVSSPPYINVFNYHQNYRRSVELLGWDVLRVARSEIGSNRANRVNRFLTVAQYCIDMADVLQELARVLSPGGRAVLIVGYESKVLGVPFYNADIIEQLARNLGMFDLVLRQERIFRNRFGQDIREDILNLERTSYRNGDDLAATVGRRTASVVLESGLSSVLAKNRIHLEHALARVSDMQGTPVFDSGSYDHYQTRNYVMMVKEEEENNA